MALDVDQITTREHASGDFPMYQTLFGQEHQDDQDHRHVMMPSLLTADLIVGHAAGALGIFESLLDELAVGLHAGQSPQ